jgi:hypothetical protein
MTAVDAMGPHPYWRRVAATTGLVAVGAVVIVAYASLARPLWIDEFLQFAVGGMEPARVLDTISQTTGDGVNHGQTGLYFVLDYALLQVFGASTLALRAPSIVAAGVMLTAAVHVMRLKGYSFAWQYFVLIAFAGQVTLMYYVGEARPYMLLASSAIALLAYYQTPPPRRRSRSVQALGLYGVLLGAVAHPYFPLFLVLAIGFTWWQRSFDRGQALDRHEVRHLINFPLVGGGLILYLLVGAMTWLRGSPDFEFDPFEPYGSAVDTWHRLISTHLGVVPLSALSPTALLLVLGALTAVVAGLGTLLGVRRFLPPLVLMALGLLSSILLIVASAVRSYWIFDRQWVAGIAVMTVGIAWLVAEAGCAATSLTDWRGRTVRLVVGVIVGLITANALLAVGVRWIEFTDQRAARTAFEAEKRSGLGDPRRTPTEDWVEYANRNVSVGGPVWPGLGEYYAD